MNKDVIYIDIDDDVTAIIGKIKKAKEKIVALVPPKRVGVLQSAVNLRLLDRMAKNEKKQLVLITGNQALVSLAASAQIPVAKNLQSKPEIAEIPAIIVDDGDDIIDGSQIPIGEHAKSVKTKDGTKAAVGKAIASKARADDIDTTDLNIEEDESPFVPGANDAAVKKGKAKPKIPNFDSFRKKLVFGGLGLAALVALLVWMFVFAPSATVVITATTEPVSVSVPVKLGGTTATSFKDGILTSVTQTNKVEETVEFEATGEKDVGDRASGSMTLTRTSVSNVPISIPAGTVFTSGANRFTSTEAASLSGTSIGGSGIVQDSVTVRVVAENPGEQYNVSARQYQSSVGGFSSRGSVMTGGTTKLAKVVSEEDIEIAKGKLIGESTDEQKAALIKKFTNGEVVVESSFAIERGEAASLPALDQESVDGKAKLTISTTYTIQAAPRADLDSYLKQYIESKISSDTQKIYNTGIDSAKLGNFREDGDSSLATLTARASVGPKIDEDMIKEQVRGKRYGEIQQSLQMINGVKDVDVQFPYFWVRTVPDNIDKITIEFKLDDGK